MRQDIFLKILSPFGQDALRSAEALAPREVDFLSHFQSLSRRYPPDIARAALEIAILRLEAGDKFPFASKMYFTREAMEQSSNWPVAVYRASRYRGHEMVFDLGCSIGGDTLALAGEASTVGLDLDHLRLAMARANLVAVERPFLATFAQANLKSDLPLRCPDAAVFFDPARRSGRRRVKSVRAYLPPLNSINKWLPHYGALGVKLSPGVNLQELAEFDAEIEFISLGGKLKEAVLWFGPLKTASRRATLLPGGQSLSLVDRPEPGIPPGPLLPIDKPRAYLYEPDPAVIRAGMVRPLGDSLSAAQLDADIAYLTTDTYQPTPFARAWAVEDWFPFQLKRLRRYLRARGIGRVTVKKRGSPLVPEVLIHELKLRGPAERVLFLTHLRGKPIVVIAQVSEQLRSG